MSRRVAVIGGGLATAAALAALLSTCPGIAIMPERRRELEAGYDMNDLIDLEGKRRRKADRKSRLRELQRQAFAKELDQ